MTNERQNNLGLKRMLVACAWGFGLIGFGEVAGQVPLDREIIEKIEYPAKAIGYAFAGGVTLLIAGASLMAGGRKIYEISRELRND